MFLNVCDDAMELIEAFRGLRIEIDIAREIEFLHIVKMGYDNSVAACLPYESHHLSMTWLAENDDSPPRSPLGGII